jgi:hypothetical protein
MGFGRLDWLTSMPENRCASNFQSTSSDLISFFKAIPDGPLRRGAPPPVAPAACGSAGHLERLPQLAVSGTFCAPAPGRVQPSAGAGIQALDLRFHVSVLATASRKPDGYNKTHLQEFDQVLQAWMISQIPYGAEGLDKLV